MGKEQQMNFGFMDVILLVSVHKHISATHAPFLRVVITRTQM